MADPQKSFWSDTKLVIVAVVLIAAIIGVTAIVSSGSNSDSAAKKAASAQAHELAASEEAEEATDPSIPRYLGAMIVAHPHNEVATEEQLTQQIITNEESSDPAHEPQAWCSYGSAYSHYVNYNCEGYSVGSSGVLGHIEVTVDTNTGEVLVEDE
jgi:uncharacterized protein (UPF0333 family)